LGVEIERKFLVDKAKWETARPKVGAKIIQGYILKTREKTVRIRVKGDSGFITIKGQTKGVTRPEFEFPIPKSEAEEILNEFCPKRIIKIRYELMLDGFVWEIDEFESPKAGLILAEIELSNENQEFLKPDWLGKEVSNEPEYFNANMI